MIPIEASPPRPTEPLAVVSATMGVLSVPLVVVCLLGGFTGVASIACGLIGRGRIRRSHAGPSPTGGLGLTVVGIAGGGVAVLATLLVLAAIAAASPGG